MNEKLKFTHCETIFKVATEAGSRKVRGFVAWPLAFDKEGMTGLTITHLSTGRSVLKHFAYEGDLDTLYWNLVKRFGMDTLTHLDKNRVMANEVKYYLRTLDKRNEMR